MALDGKVERVLFEGERFDCGSKVGFLQANIAFALQRADLQQRLRGWLDERKT